MYHPPSKRTQLLQRIIVYSAMSLAVVVIVVVLAFFMLGYQFNRVEGTIEQGGLVQFNSHPAGAAVIIDGKNLGIRTAAKRTMAPGPHFIKMQRAGYQAWQKSVEVMPGSVLWLTYARLVPKELKPVSVESFPVITSTAASPNNEMMAMKTKAATPVIHVADLSRDDARITEITLPDDSFTPPSPSQSQSFTLETWDSSSRYLLIKHTYDKNKIEWIVADTQDMSSTKNVTKLVGMQMEKPIFDDDDPTILYALVDNDIRRIDLDAATLSRPLVSNVDEFTLYGDATLVYVTRLDPETKVRSVGYFSQGSTKPRTIRSYSDNGKIPLHIAIGQYFSQYYVAIAYNETVEVMKGTLPRSDVSNPSAYEAVATMTIPGGARYLSIMTSGRFVVAQTDHAYIVHDIELNKTTTTTLKGDKAVKQKLQWLDNYTVWSDQTGILRIYEFDGANQHDIMPVSPGFSATYSPNDTYLYGINKSDDGKFHLTRVRMLLN